MKETIEETKLILKLLEEIKSKFDTIKQPNKFYRNKDLRESFGLSDNTIISYREKNILPFSKIGEIYYYPMDKIESILTKHSNFDLFGNPF